MRKKREAVLSASRFRLVLIGGLEVNLYIFHAGFGNQPVFNRVNFALRYRLIGLRHQDGGIRAVAMATPGITLLLLFRVLPIMPAVPPKRAISSAVGSVNGVREKYRVEAIRLMTTCAANRVSARRSSVIPHCQRISHGHDTAHQRGNQHGADDNRRRADIQANRRN